MAKLIEIAGLWVQPHKVAAVREAKLSKKKDQTIIYFSGQSPLDGGFLVDLSIDEVVEMLQDALSDEDGRSFRYGR